MRHKALLLAAAAALAAIPALTPATAEPAPGGAAVRGDTIPGAVMVQYYAYPGDPDYGYGGPGLLDVPDEVILGTAGVVGDVLGGPVYVGRYPRPEIIACERRFRSFDPLTGTYTSYTGEQVLCPYLGG